MSHHGCNKQQSASSRCQYQCCEPDAAPGCSLESGPPSYHSHFGHHEMHGGRHGFRGGFGDFNGGLGGSGRMRGHHSHGHHEMGGRNFPHFMHRGENHHRGGPHHYGMCRYERHQGPSHFGPGHHGPHPHFGHHGPHHGPHHGHHGGPHRHGGPHGHRNFGKHHEKTGKCRSASPSFAARRRHSADEASAEKHQHQCHHH